MTVKANGTHAKEVAIHFLNLTTDGRYTPSVVGRTIHTSKSILASGYSKEEIIKTIDYLHDVKKVNMYSIGYVSAVIGDALKDIEALERIDAERAKPKVEENISREVQQFDHESSERNKQKASRNSIQSRFGKKFDFHLLEE